MSIVTNNPIKIDYSKHPVFTDYFGVSKNVRNSDLNDLCLELDQMLFDLEEKLIFDKKFEDYVKKPLELIGRFWKILEEGAKVKDSNGFKEYINKIRNSVSHDILEDLAYYNRRGTYEPIYYNCDQLEKGVQLDENGYYIESIDNLDIELFDKLIQPYKNKILKSYESGSRSREELSINIWDNNVSEAIAKLVTTKDIPLIVSNHRFDQVDHIGFALELSPPDAQWWKNKYDDRCFNGSRDTVYYHYDESRVVYKAILYLNDITSEEYGATSVIPQSYKWNLPRFQWAIGRAIGGPPSSGDELSTENYIEYFMQFPECSQFVSGFGWDVLKDSAIEKKLIQERQIITGPKGTIVVFAGGNIIHRGGLVEEGHRWVCQIIFHVRNKEIN